MHPGELDLVVAQHQEQHLLTCTKLVVVLFRAELDRPTETEWFSPQLALPDITQSPAIVFV